MKEGIHPEYIEATISCACGNVVTTRATVDSMHVDICAKCHPFFTGKRQSVADRGGRIEQFNKRYGVEASDAAGDGDAAPDEEVPASAQA